MSQSCAVRNIVIIAYGRFMKTHFEITVHSDLNILTVLCKVHSLCITSPAVNKHPTQYSKYAPTTVLHEQITHWGDWSFY